MNTSSRRYCPILTSFALPDVKEILNTDAFLPPLLSNSLVYFIKTLNCTQRFAAAIMRIRNPKTTALIFASGKMVCTGAKTEALAREAARKYAKVIIKLGFPAQFKDFKIQNMVGSCDVKFPIRLEGLAWSHGHFAQYEPELFPGLIYRMQMPKIVLLIFVSGKIVLTGGKRREDIYQAFENIYPVLTEFKKLQLESDEGDAGGGAAGAPKALPVPSAKRGRKPKA